jgi:hypothetical protein
MVRKCIISIVFALCLINLGISGAKNNSALKPEAKVFIASMPDGFDTFLKSAMAKKKVPLTIVESRESAEFEITGASETQKAGAAKKILQLNWHSAEQASIAIANLKTGEVVFAYSVNKESSAHGKQSTAEACAKHIKEFVTKK